MPYKACLPSILPVITNLFNASPSSGCFPRDWKLAEVVAHPKDSDYEVAGNNCPISLLPVLSKVLECIAQVQLVSFLTSNKLLSLHQSGNGRCHSTETLGVLFTSHLYKAIDEKKVTALLMLDLSKAFDSINHQKLLIKLRSVGDGSVANFFCRVNALLAKKTRISRRGKSCVIAVNLGTTHYLWRGVGLGLARMKGDTRSIHFNDRGSKVLFGIDDESCQPTPSINIEWSLSLSE